MATLEEREAMFPFLTPREVLQLMMDKDIADAYSNCIQRTADSVTVDSECMKRARAAIIAEYGP